MECEPIEELLAPYALGALSAQEMADVEAHVASCARCRHLVSEFRAVVAHLPYSVPLVDPPPDLKARALRRVRDAQGLRDSRAQAAQGRRRLRLGRLVFGRRAAWAFVGTVAVLALAAWGGYLQTQVNDLKEATHSLGEVVEWQGALADLLVSPSVTVRELRGTEEVPQARARLLVDPDANEAMLVAINLAPLPTDRVYQLWLIKDGQRSDGGIFTVNHEGRGYLAVRSPEPLLSYTFMGVTDEPTGGSPTPTGQRVLQLVP